MLMKSTPSSQVPQAIRSRANHNLGRLVERPSEQPGPGPRPARGQQRLLRREGPQGVTEERDKAGVDRRSCSRSRGNIPSPSPTKTSCYAPRRAARLRKPSGPVCVHRGWWGGGAGREKMSILQSSGGLTGRLEGLQRGGETSTLGDQTPNNTPKTLSGQLKSVVWRLK